MTLRAIGLDPGWAKSALAVVERDGNRLILVHRKLIVTKPTQSPEAREDVIWAALVHAMREFKPRILGIEDQAGMAAAARVQNSRAASDAAKGRKRQKSLGFNAVNDNVIGAVWLAKGAARDRGIARVMVTPQQAKIAVLGKGGGKAEKSQVIAAVTRLFPELAGAKPKLSDHEADAIAIAILAGRMLVQGVAVA